jgi:hypothetical protein
MTTVETTRGDANQQEGPVRFRGTRGKGRSSSTMKRLTSKNWRMIAFTAARETEGLSELATNLSGPICAATCFVNRSAVGDFESGVGSTDFKMLSCDRVLSWNK